MYISTAKRLWLSNNFTLWEFLRTFHGDLIEKQLQIPLEYINNLQRLCVNVLQPVRNNFGAVEITSGYRCEELNNRVGGSPTSDHSKGLAADFRCQNIEAALEFIKNNLEFKQLIDENGLSWIHVSFEAGNNKKQVFKI